MTTQPKNKNEQHDYVWELLPWYVNDGLSPQELDEVDAHLLDCPSCQSEVVRCKNEYASVKSNERDTWAPSAAHFAKVIENVDAFEKRAAQSNPPAGWLAKWLPWLSTTPGPARFTLGLQGALVLALASTLFYRVLIPTEGYRTLSNPGAQTQGARIQFRVVFADDITEKQLRELLLSIDSQVIEGPSPLGVYSIALSEKNSNSNSAVQALAKLRANAKVRLAEMKNGNIE
jgi:hypothetical protein